MESTQFTMSAPSGDITPTVAGTPAPRLVAGKVGSALRLEGAELNYGKPAAECFFDTNLCVNGLSVSLWVKFYAISDASDSMIFADGTMLTARGCQYIDTRMGLSPCIFLMTTIYVTVRQLKEIFFTGNTSCSPGKEARPRSPCTEMGVQIHTVRGWLTDTPLRRRMTSQSAEPFGVELLREATLPWITCLCGISHWHQRWSGSSTYKVVGCDRHTSLQKGNPVLLSLEISICDVMHSTRKLSWIS